MTARSKSLLKSVCLVWIFAAGLAGCSNDHVDEKRLVFALESEPERLDPLTIKNPQTFRVAWQIYEGLLGLTEDGQVRPMLAKSWHSDDFQTWVFKLRENAVFHPSPVFGQGTQPRGVTASDVVWSYTAFCSPGAYASFVLVDSIEGCADYNAGKADAVSGLDAIDTHTVQITLNQPEPFFLNRITTAWIAIFPEESSQEAFRDVWGLKLATGTGPFRLVSRSDTEIVLERNPDYWDESRLPEIEKLIFRVMKNSQTRFAEFKKGSIE